MKCQIATIEIFPSIMNGINVHSGPIPSSLANTGETIATVMPDVKPHIMTEMIRIKFTIEPVINVFANDDVTICAAINRAIHIAVWVIHNTFLFITFVPLSLVFWCFLLNKHGKWLMLSLVT